MKKTKKMLLIENVFNNDLEVLLKQWYIDQRMSDRRIAGLFRQHNIVVDLSTIWCWRERLAIVSRSQPISHKVCEKTLKMQVLETAMGGQECNKIIPWLWSLGKTSKEIAEFLNGFLCEASDTLSPRTLKSWLRVWGCRPNEWASVRQSNVRRRYCNRHPKINPQTRLKISQALKNYFKKHPEAATKRSGNIVDFFVKHPEIKLEANLKISQTLKKYFKEHPEATLKRSKDMIAFHARNPNMRLKISQINSRVSRQRWAKQETARFCPLISENLAEDLCKKIQGSDCEDCSFYSKEVRT